MTAIILFSILAIVVLSAVIYFLFAVLLTSLRAQRINASDPLFSKEEIKYETGHPTFTQVKTGKKAVVLCSPERSLSERRFKYNGKKDCSLFKSIYDAEYDCGYGCSGFGNCVYACPRQAITIENGTAVVNSSCNGCGICITTCPKQLIVLIPEDQTTCVLCKAASDDKVGCTMCGKESKLKIYSQKHFIFWEKCYKIVNRK